MPLWQRTQIQEMLLKLDEGVALRVSPSPAETTAKQPYHIQI